MRRLVLLVVLLSTSAHASTEEAWAEMRADVAARCRALLPNDAVATVEVNLFGSERFAAAFVTMQAEDSVERMICIYEKQTKAAELTAPFD